MKIKFEKWIDDNSFSDNIKDIFADAVTCYKNGVDRAALILSYIAFMNILKERLLNHNSTLDEDGWGQLSKDLNNESFWERNVFMTTQKGRNSDQKYQVFLINNDIRDQILFWRDRRNDCAHSKSNIIDSCHVDAFWAFLRSNLNKITVEGGKQSLLNKFIEFFDAQYTPRDADSAPLIEQIKYCVDSIDIDSFWKDVIKIVEEKKKYDFINKVLSSKDDKMRLTMVNVLKNEKKECFFHFLFDYPKKIPRFFSKGEDIRFFWNKDLFRCENFLDIYANMLNAYIIPKDQINEANAHIAKHLTNGPVNRYIVDPQNNSILKNNNFIIIFEDIFFVEDLFSNFENINNKAVLLCDFLKINGFTEKSVKFLCKHFAESYFARILLSKLISFFYNNADKKDQFSELAKANSIEIPCKLTAFHATSK